VCISWTNKGHYSINNFFHKTKRIPDVRSQAFDPCRRRTLKLMQMWIIRSFKDIWVVLDVHSWSIAGHPHWQRGTAVTEYVQSSPMWHPPNKGVNLLSWTYTRTYKYIRHHILHCLYQWVQLQKKTVYIQRNNEVRSRNHYCGRKARSIKLQLKCDDTRRHTGGEVKGKLVNGVGSQYPSHYLGTWCIQHYYRW